MKEDQDRFGIVSSNNVLTLLMTPNGTISPGANNERKPAPQIDTF
jgi:hypothetical protein